MNHIFIHNPVHSLFKDIIFYIQIKAGYRQTEIHKEVLYNILYTEM
jgi:hypothetical protein